MAGYQTLWQKVGLLVSANLSALMDRALSMNSVAVFDEYLNRMRAELGALQSAEGFERGRVKTLTRQIGVLEKECERFDLEVDRLLVNGQRGLAAARQTMLNTKRNLIEQLTQSLNEARGEVERLASARQSLSVQIDTTEVKRSELRSLLAQKQAAEMRAAAMVGVTGRAGASSFAQDMIERVRQDTEIAQGRAEAGAINLDSQIEDVIGAQDVELQLQEREERLQAKAPEDETESPETGEHNPVG